MKLWLEKGAWASKKGHAIAQLMNPESVHSIAIIRHAAIGDMMVLRPFLIQARDFFPNASITLSIVNNYAYGIPKDLVDRIHIVEKKKDGKKTSYLHRLKQIRELGEHDILFDMADTSLAGFITWMSKAQLKIGFPYRQIKNYLLFDIGLVRSDLIPEVETLLHFLYILGAQKQKKLEYGYPVSATKEKRIIYFMGASTPEKQWPKMRFAELIRIMAERYQDYQHILLEGIRSDESAEDVFEANKHLSNISKIAAMPLDQTMSYLADSALIVCNDTGVRNMAIAVQTATVGIFFATVPYRYWPDATLHSAVYSSDGSIPEVHEVAVIINTCLQS